VGPGNWVKQQLSNLLESGRLVVIFDGLNEMPHRSQFGRVLETQVFKSQGEQLAEDLSTGNLIPRNCDSRELSLRELAQSHGVHSRFIVSCRTHEFSGSVAWTRIHVLPMDDNQIREFLDRHLREAQRADLNGVLANKPMLWELARNPFYLVLITTIAANDLATVESRGHLIRKVLGGSIEREEKRRNQNIDDRRFVRVLSRLAFKMIEADMIGSRVDLQTVGAIDAESRSLGIDTGFLVERDGTVVFRHQLFQEFFAALALERRHVWRSLGRLLRNDKWAEVVILYHGVSAKPYRCLQRIRKLLRHRNGLTLHPFQPPLFLLVRLLTLIVYGFVTASFAFDAVVGGGFWLDLARHHPLSLATYFATPFFLWYLLPAVCFHRKAIVNAAYVLARVVTAETMDETVEELVLSFNRVGIVLRSKIAESLRNANKKMNLVEFGHVV
jgi:hypothetical protein